MDGFRVAGALVVGALTAAYLYFGGRFSIALVIIVGYGIYCNEASGGSQDSQEKLDLNKQQKSHVAVIRRLRMEEKNWRMLF